MLLEDKRAVVYGAGGAVGGAVARAFAREGAKVFLTGRSMAKLEAVAEEIAAAGGQSEIAQVDALDRDQIEAHAATVASAGGIETFTRVLAGEVGPRGVRVVCLRPDALPET